MFLLFIISMYCNFIAQAIVNKIHTYILQPNFLPLIPKIYYVFRI